MNVRLAGGSRVIELVAWLATVCMVVVAPATPVPAAARPIEGSSATALSVVPHADAVPFASTVGPSGGPSLPVLTWPVSGRIVAPWDGPAGPYAPGHRGVDLAASAGQSVTAMGTGVVGWAGVVAGTAWVSVDHAGGVRTTVGPMATIAVDAGQAVTVATRLGTVTGVAHPGDPDGVAGSVHVSVRIDGVYVDPTGQVGRLVPTLLPPTR
ncbi:MAG TPA: peptidoglycan DD-metalloendopeptidase family protein [Nitriliruptoraceae bacterium]|nr:peptidoglycan DD-metalloendopeptidase family protein [Nitriliruptoraceae bacterium]